MRRTVVLNTFQSIDLEYERGGRGRIICILYIDSALFSHWMLTNSLNIININTLFANFGPVAYIEQNENDIAIVDIYSFSQYKRPRGRKMLKECLFLSYYPFPVEDLLI